MFLVFILAALLSAAAAFWILRAWRREAAGARPLQVLVVCGAAAVGALALYVAIGRPDLPDAPYQQRLAQIRQRDPNTYSIDEAIAVLDQAAKANPRDAQPHIFLGQLQLERGNPQAAAGAFDAALRRDPNSSEAMLGLGRALVRLDNGHVSPEALRLFQTVGATTRDPTAWVYQAMAAMQDGRAEEARRCWGEALARMAPDDPRRAMAQRMSTARP